MPSAAPHVAPPDPSPFPCPSLGCSPRALVALYIEVPSPRTGGEAFPVQSRTVPSLAAVPDAPRDRDVPPGTRAQLIQIPLVIHQDQVPSQSCSPASPSQPVGASRAALAQLQNPAPACVKPHTAGDCQPSDLSRSLQGLSALGEAAALPSFVPSADFPGVPSSYIQVGHL